MKNKKIMTNIMYILTILFTITSLAMSIVVPIITKKLYFIIIFILLTILFLVVTLCYYGLIKTIQNKKISVTRLNQVELNCNRASSSLVMISFTLIIVFTYFIVLYRAFKPFVLIFLVTALLALIYSFNLHQITGLIKENKKEQRNIKK